MIETEQRNEKANFREHYQVAINKSEDDFEKNLIFLSSGALGLTLIFIEKIVPPKDSICLYLLIIGWGLLALTLAVNLISHLISKKDIQKSQSDYDNYVNETIDYDKLVEKQTIRNKKMDCINWLSVIIFISGILTIVLYTSLNFQNMAKKTTSSTKTTIRVEKVQLGRTSPTPQKPVVQNTIAKPNKDKK